MSLTPADRLARSWSACHAALFPDPTFPPRRWEDDVAGYLWERGYHPDSIRRVLEHASSRGSVECCLELSFWPLDREHVESLLPVAPECDWSRHDGFAWTLG